MVNIFKRYSDYKAKQKMAREDKVMKMAEMGKGLDMGGMDERDPMFRAQAEASRLRYERELKAKKTKAKRYE